MGLRHQRLRIPFAAAIAVLGLAGTGVLCAPWLKEHLSTGQPKDSEKAEPAKSVALVAGLAETVRISGDVAREVGIKTAIAEPASHGTTLELPGTLILDTNLLSRVHARFAGEIVELGKPAGMSRTIDLGDRVAKDQLLAVVWSRDLGEKKSELIDGVSQLRVDEETLARLSETAKDGAIPERSLREAERHVEADRIAVARTLRTLETWRVPQEEIDAVRAEAAALSHKPDRPRDELVHRWARSEVRSPFDGVVLERNIAMGDLVDTGLDLFKIADLSRLRVVANAYEEDLPALDALKGNQRRWTVRLGAEPEAEPRPGQFDGIGQIIDPSQHTAMVRGWVDNRDGRLRVGQFITAAVEVPPLPDEVAIPATAVVEVGDRRMVFVESDEHGGTYARRYVALRRREPATVFVASRLTKEEEHRGLSPLRPGEKVVASGAVQLTAALAALESSTASAK